MVAQKRGRGAKAQAAKPKAAPSVEEQVQEAEMTEAAEATEQNNGQDEPVEQAEGNADASMEAQEATEDNAEPASEEPPKPDGKKEEKEEKTESGKLLVENLPSSFLFDYQERLKEIFSKHGEILTIKRGPIIVTELTTTPTLSAIVEFKNKDSLEKALCEEGTVVDGSPIAVAVESRADTAVLVGVPHEASVEYVRLLFAQCGDVASIHEFGKTKYKILRVTFHEKEAVAQALKLDRELRINGFLVTVNKYRDDDDKPNHNKNKRQHPSNVQPNRSLPPPPLNNVNRNNTFRPPPRVPTFNARPNFRGGRGGRGGFLGRGGFGPRGGFAPPVNAPYMPPPQGFMGRPGGFMNDGQRPNKRLRPM